MTDGPADIYDPAFVKGVFDRCSRRYIFFSTFCSMGFTERWRRECVDGLDLPDAADLAGFDLMAGTGEVWPHLFRRYPRVAEITAVDISSGMHALAMDRLHKERSHRIAFIEDNVLASDLPAGSADFILSTFGLKTFNPDQLRQLAALTARLLRSGGRFSFIEASDPKGWVLRPLYLFYLKGVLPTVERLFLRGAQDFAMIGTYCTNFGDAGDFAAMLREAGLTVRLRRHFFGCATSVAGEKP